MASRHQNQEEDRSAGDHYLDFDSFAAALADSEHVGIRFLAAAAGAAAVAAGLDTAGYLAEACRLASASR